MTETIETLHKKYVGSNRAIVSNNQKRTQAIRDIERAHKDEEERLFSECDVTRQALERLGVPSPTNPYFTDFGAMPLDELTSLRDRVGLDSASAYLSDMSWPGPHRAVAIWAREVLPCIDREISFRCTRKDDLALWVEAAIKMIDKPGSNDRLYECIEDMIDVDAPQLPLIELARALVVSRAGLTATGRRVLAKLRPALVTLKMLDP